MPPALQEDLFVIFHRGISHVIIIINQMLLQIQILHMAVILTFPIFIKVL